MSKPIILTEQQWGRLNTRLKNDYSPSVMMIRPKMREVLGFTPREHTEWVGYYDTATKEEKKAGWHGYKKKIHLDFYNEPKRTMFVLKYSEYLEKPDLD